MTLCNTNIYFSICKYGSILLHLQGMFFAKNKSHKLTSMTKEMQMQNVYLFKYILIHASKPTLGVNIIVHFLPKHIIIIRYVLIKYDLMCGLGSMTYCPSMKPKVSSEIIQRRHNKTYYNFLRLYQDKWITLSCHDRIEYIWMQLV